MHIAVLGAGGFIGGHLVGRLLREGHDVRAFDIKPLKDWWQAHDGVPNHSHFDLRLDRNARTACADTEHVYQLAADMGGAGYVFTGDNDAAIMHNSMQINLNVAAACKRCDVKRILYTSSACIYPAHNQTDPDNPKCNEDSAYPAACDSEYGWEKIISERLYANYMRNYGLEVRIARLHNVMGEFGSWDDGKEKAPAATCRKIAEAGDGDTIEIWGDGKQTRSFMYVDDCIDGLTKLMASDHSEPINIGREEMVSIDDLFDMVAEIAGKDVKFEHNLTKPQGVRGRNSDNTKLREVLGWEPQVNLHDGLCRVYNWIEEQMTNAKPSI